MTRIALLLLAALVSACASAGGPPTVDVTGFWVGTWSAPNMGSGIVELRLEQKGADVNGDLVWRGSMEGPRAGASLNPTGALKGKVGGRTFTFDRSPAAGKGDFTVEGDEMRGYITTTQDAAVRLRRQR